MNHTEFGQGTLVLPEREVTSMAAKLLDTTAPAGTDIPDAEVKRRERELESGMWPRIRTRSSCAVCHRNADDEGGLPASRRHE